MGAIMKKWVLLGMLVLGCSLSAGAQAGVYSQRLISCLLKEATPQDKQVFIQRFFLVFAANKDLKDLVNISDRKQQGVQTQFSKTFNRLFNESCREQTDDVVNFEGPAALGAAGQALSRVALKDFFSDPSVNTQLAEVGQEVSKVLHSNPQIDNAPANLEPLVSP
jgi:hypothetical protein